MIYFIWAVFKAFIVQNYSCDKGFSNNPDAVAKMDNGLNHNDFRRKYLMKLQAETVFRTSYAPLQHFYEILHKFAKKDDEAPQKAQR